MRLSKVDVYVNGTKTEHALLNSNGITVTDSDSSVSTVDLSDKYTMNKKFAVEFEFDFTFYSNPISSTHYLCTIGKKTYSPVSDALTIGLKYESGEQYLFLGMLDHNKIIESTLMTSNTSLKGINKFKFILNYEPQLRVEDKYKLYLSRYIDAEGSFENFKLAAQFKIDNIVTGINNFQINDFIIYTGTTGTNNESYSEDSAEFNNTFGVVLNDTIKISNINVSFNDILYKDNHTEHVSIINNNNYYNYVGKNNDTIQVTFKSSLFNSVKENFKIKFLNNETLQLVTDESFESSTNKKVYSLNYEIINFTDESATDLSYEIYYKDFTPITKTTAFKVDNRTPTLNYIIDNITSSNVTIKLGSILLNTQTFDYANYDGFKFNFQFSNVNNYEVISTSNISDNTFIFDNEDYLEDGVIYKITGDITSINKNFTSNIYPTTINNRTLNPSLILLDPKEQIIKTDDTLPPTGLISFEKINTIEPKINILVNSVSEAINQSLQYENNLKSFTFISDDVALNDTNVYSISKNSDCNVQNLTFEYEGDTTKTSLNISNLENDATLDVNTDYYVYGIIEDSTGNFTVMTKNHVEKFVNNAYGIDAVILTRNDYLYDVNSSENIIKNGDKIQVKFNTNYDLPVDNIQINLKIGSSGTFKVQTSSISKTTSITHVEYIAVINAIEIHSNDLQKEDVLHIKLSSPGFADVNETTVLKYDNKINSTVLDTTINYKPGDLNTIIINKTSLQSHIHEIQDILEHYKFNLTLNVFQDNSGSMSNLNISKEFNGINSSDITDDIIFESTGTNVIEENKQHIIKGSITNVFNNNILDIEFGRVGPDSAIPQINTFTISSYSGTLEVTNITVNDLDSDFDLYALAIQTNNNSNSINTTNVMNLFNNATIDKNIIVKSNQSRELEYNFNENFSANTELLTCFKKVDDKILVDRMFNSNLTGELLEVDEIFNTHNITLAVLVKDSTNRSNIQIKNIDIDHQIEQISLSNVSFPDSVFTTLGSNVSLIVDTKYKTHSNNLEIKFDDVSLTCKESKNDKQFIYDFVIPDDKDYIIHEYNLSNILKDQFSNDLIIDDKTFNFNNTSTNDMFILSDEPSFVLSDLTYTTNTIQFKGTISDTLYSSEYDNTNYTITTDEYHIGASTFEKNRTITTNLNVTSKETDITISDLNSSNYYEISVDYFDPVDNKKTLNLLSEVESKLIITTDIVSPSITINTFTYDSATDEFSYDVNIHDPTTTIKYYIFVANRYNDTIMSLLSDVVNVSKGSIDTKLSTNKTGTLSNYYDYDDEAFQTISQGYEYYLIVYVEEYEKTIAPYNELVNFTSKNKKEFKSIITPHPIRTSDIIDESGTLSGLIVYYNFELESLSNYVENKFNGVKNGNGKITLNNTTNAIVETYGAILNASTDKHNIKIVNDSDELSSLLTNTFSISTWIKISQKKTFDLASFYSNDSTTSISFIYDSGSGDYKLKYKESEFSVNVSFNVDEWYHIAIVKQIIGSNDEIEFYINSVLIEKLVAPSTSLSTLNKIYIFGSGESTITNVFKGHIDDFRLYNIPLSINQIYNIYNIGSTVVISSTVDEEIIEEDVELVITTLDETSTTIQVNPDSSSGTSTLLDYESFQVVYDPTTEELSIIEI